MVGDNRTEKEKGEARWEGQVDLPTIPEPCFAFMVRLDGNMAKYGPAIRTFVDAMVYKLERNAHKGKWEGLRLPEALELLKKEVEELSVEVKGDQNMVKVLLEAADVANFALIISSIITERGR